MTSECLGCGAPTNPENPVSSRCGSCPPWICETCGQLDSTSDSCGCWVSLDGLNLADLKAVLALGDLSVTSPTQTKGDRF